MKTLSFHDYKVGRDRSQTLLELDTSQDQISFQAGLNLIIAPNGYGKTTLLQSIAGVLPSQDGRVELDTKKLSAEDQVLYISEYLNFPKFIRPHEWIEFVAQKSISKDDLTSIRSEIDGFSLQHKMQSYLGRMSQGERRKVTWLAAHTSTKPLVLLDEPLDGLDLLSIDCARKILKSWVASERIICIVAHQVSELLDLCNEAFLIRNKKLVPWSTVHSTPISETPSETVRHKVLEFYSKK